MSIVLGGLAARAFWTSRLTPLSPTDAKAALTQSRYSAKTASTIAATQAFQMAEPMLRCGQAARDPLWRPIWDEAGHAVGWRDLPPVPMDYYVGANRRSYPLKGERRHWVKRFPLQGSILSVDEEPGLFVVSPAAHIVLSARWVDDVASVIQAMELCGTYLLRPDTRWGFSRSEKPLTSQGEIQSVVDQCRGLKGVKRARRSAAAAIAGSASPMESALTLLLTLPLEQGGYGLPAPLLNPTVATEPTARGLTGGAAALRPDLFWPDAALDLEYDSDTYHGDPSRAEADRGRRTALQIAGVDPVSVTRSMVADPDICDNLARLVARRLGVPFYAPDPAQQRLLRTRLLGRHLPL